MTTGERIKEARLHAGLTQTELAQKMGYKSKAAISKIETNVNDITQSTIVKFAEVLDTSVSYLMGWEEEDTQNKLREAANRMAEEQRLLELFRQLTPEQQRLVIVQLRAIVQSQADQGAG